LVTFGWNDATLVWLVPCNEYAIEGCVEESFILPLSTGDFHAVLLEFLN
jgi:hypothetical protein